ncbi:MAG: recombination protein O N-terminal domain-containing protein, partial [Candidatus Aureabacteria bacterium]|nr:recombination protein O N-terminal domain-containing protein [Candidatus Auribacterota bacterium]
MTFKTPGIILRSYKYGESSRIIVFLTPVIGKLKASAKGVDRQKSKFSKPQLFNVYSLDVQAKRDREIDIIV